MSKHKPKRYVCRLTEDADNTLYNKIHNYSCLKKIHAHYAL